MEYGIQEKGIRLFSSWTTTQNTNALTNILKYMDIVGNQYNLVEMISVFLTPLTKIKIVYVILESLTNFS
jgi:hypothetical protein